MDTCSNGKKIDEIERLLSGQPEVQSGEVDPGVFFKAKVMNVDLMSAMKLIVGMLGRGLSRDKVMEKDISGNKKLIWWIIGVGGTLFCSIFVMVLSVVLKTM